MTLYKSPTETKSKTNIAFLRIIIDTLGENFIYEESLQFKNYSPIFLCGLVKRLDKEIKHFCFKEFVKLYQPQWPVFPKSLEETYHTGIAKYKNIINKLNIQLIHAQFLTDAVFCLQLIKESNLPLIVNLRGYDLFHPKAQTFLSDILPFTSKLIVKSESMKSICTSYGCDPAKVEVIYGGVNTDKIIFKPRIATQNNINILSSGRFVDKKGYDTTLRFFSELLKSHPNSKLTLVGEGDLKNDLVKLIDRLGIMSKVTIKDYLPHQLFIKELYKHNLFILPSRIGTTGDQEGIPNVLKEAMASGMPVISTYHSGIPELIKDNETGYLALENDPQGILKKVQYILENKEEAFMACLNARFFVEKYFNVKKTAAQVEKLYNYLLMPIHAQSAIDLRKGKKPTEFRVDLHVQKGCNSECIMCDNWKNQPMTSYSRENISMLLDQLRSFGVDQVRFHGQEPTLMKDLFSIIKEAKNKGFSVGLKTNALIFSNEQKVQMLDGTIDDLYLSIDSSDENIHNSIRGKKESFSKNMFLCENLRKINPHLNVYFNAVVTNINYRHLIGILDIAATMKANRVSFVHLSTNNKDNIKDLKLSKKQYKEFYFQIWPQILKKSLYYNIPASVDPYFTSLLELPMDLQIKRLNNASAEFNEEIDHFTNGLYGKKFYSENTCYGVLDHATIDWEGNVFPCCAMPRSKETAIGNIHEECFKSVWESEKYSQYRESILKGECQYKDRCSRAFRRTTEYNKYFKNESINSNEILTESQDQQNEKKHTNIYNLEKIIFYAFSKARIYHKNFKNFILSNGKIDISTLPFITREELKISFPNKEVVPNYFEEDYGIYRTSSCGSAAFLYARPLKSNVFARMSASFTQTGMWKRGNPWLKLTSLNCLETQYPIKSVSQLQKKDNKNSTAIVVPSSDNFVNEPISKIIAIYDLIKSSNARLIHANPSHLKLLLYRLKKEKLCLDGHYAVHSTYETLLPSTKKLLEEYLNCKVFNQYGCSEVGPISFTCHHGNNHIFSDTIHVEIIPDSKLKRPDIGRILVSHLKNHVMPLINYFNGDFAYVLKETKCECGLNSPIMGDVVGRETEMINYNGKVVFPLELDMLFYDLNNILIYQVIFEKGRFIVKIVPIRNSEHVATKKLTDRFKIYFEDNSLQIQIEKVEIILPKRRGKYANIIVK